MIDLRNVNAATIVYNDNRAVLDAVTPVIRYMQTVAQFGRMTLFTATPLTEKLPGVEVIQIWPTDGHGHSLWITRIIRYFVRHQFVMWFQDDGFIIDPSRWEPQFLGYDYIGAPWADGVVGNEGFCIQSQKFLWARAQFDWNEREGPDWYYCRTIGHDMRKRGVRFAPTEVASRFSSELRDHDKPTFGYHGRNYCQPKHALGQSLIQPFRPCSL